MRGLAAIIEAIHNRAEGGVNAYFLVVEGDESLQGDLVDTLRREGYAVRAAATGGVPSARVAAGALDVVVLDVTRPAALGQRLSAARRGGRLGARAGDDRIGGLAIDRAARRVWDRRGREVVLTRTEYDLLIHLLDHRGEVRDRNAILDAVWGVDVVVEERTVDNFVSSLKKKLGWEPADPFRIVTVRGVGYRFEAD